MGKLKKKKKGAKFRKAELRVPPHVYHALLLLVIVLFGAIRWRLRDMPLERDEGEYAYAGQLMLQGIPPYQLAYNMKLPGTYAAYAVIMAAFGQTPTGIHTGLLLVNAATTVLVFLLGRRLRGHLAGVTSAASYALLSTSPGVLGFAGHATHFVILPALGGLLLLLYAETKKNEWLIFASGALLGVAFVMKQPGIVFFCFAALYFGLQRWKQGGPRRDLIRSLTMLSCGAALPYALTCLLLFKAGVFAKFWFWTFDYARQYGSRLRLSEGLKELRETLPIVVGQNWTICILAGLGLAALFWEVAKREYASFLLGFLLISIAAVCPGLYFRNHYFILMLPAVALCAGWFLAWIHDALSAAGFSRFGLIAPAGIFLFAITFSVFAERENFFEADPVSVCRRMYGLNPFPEALEIAHYVTRTTPLGARVAVLGSEPEIYFYAHRRSATGYIYMYPLMEAQKFASTMQTDMISEIETTGPEILILIRTPTSWSRQPKSDDHVFTWATQYLGQFELTGSVEISTDGRSQYFWGAEAQARQAADPAAIADAVALVFKRKGS